MLTRRGLRRLAERHDLRPSRALGQNFVVDPNTVRRIARLAAVGPGDHVVEIGTGLGALTLALAETGAAVTTVETDRSLVPALDEVLADVEVHRVIADARTLDWDELLTGGDRWILVANLPYNVATPLLLDLLDDVPAVERMLVMVQLEVAQRLTAGPGDPAFGLPSLKVRFRADAEIVGRVSPEVFSPRPRVESALLAVGRREEAVHAGDPERLFELARIGFGQRRKMVRRSLAGVVTVEDLEQAQIDPTARPGELDVADWARLAAIRP